VVAILAAVLEERHGRQNTGARGWGLGGWGAKFA
jgi:hypothetical protein